MVNVPSVSYRAIEIYESANPLVGSTISPRNSFNNLGCLMEEIRALSIELLKVF